jgi:hypothetical protein
MYKIREGEDVYKGKLVNANDSIVKILVKNEERQIPVSEIKEIKQRKFSILKTIGLVPIIYVGITAIYLLHSFPINK